MKKRIKLFLAVILIIIGLGLIIYPRITDKLYKDKIDNMLDNYQETITIDEKNEDSELNALYDLLNTENQKLYTNRQQEFLEGKNHDKTYIDITKYGIADSVFGFVEVPSVNILLPIYFGSSKANMNRGATVITGTSYPIGGENTNSVIAAHRGYFKTAMFHNIDKINVGDTLRIYNFKEILEYKAVSKKIIKPEEFNALTINEGKDMITLISCHPFPYNYERYVVYFERVV